MADVFEVELSDGNSLFAELTLPATDYQLLDVLDKLRLAPEQSPRREIIDCSGYEYLNPYLNEGTLYELNDLAKKLDAMDETQRMAFEGLFHAALYRKEGPMAFSDLMKYACSVDDCCVVHGAVNDAALGRFYAANGFVSEVDDLPDNIFELLDFAKIGKDMRKAENGVFTRGGYVLHSGELKPVPDSYGACPVAPRYALSLTVARYPFENSDAPSMVERLDLPATQDMVLSVLEKVGAASWEEVVYVAADSATPGFPEDMYGDSFEELNDYAEMIMEVQANGDLPKLKSLLASMGCTTIGEATQIIEHLEEYIFEADKHSAADVAEDEIRFSFSGDEADLLLKHVDLHGYGRELLTRYNTQLTEYGAISRRDGQPLQQPEPNESQMTM